MTGWNKEQTTTFIDLYRQYPCLYDPRDKDYTKRDIRHMALIEMCKAMGTHKPNIQPSEVKQKIRTLRNQYSKEKSTLMKSLKKENSDPYIPKLWCFNDLAFLSEESVGSRDSSIIKIAVSN